MGKAYLQTGDYVFRLRKSGPEFYKINDTSQTLAFTGGIRLKREVLDGLCEIPAADREPLPPQYIHLTPKTYKRFLKRNYANQLPGIIREHLRAAAKRQLSANGNPQQGPANSKHTQVYNQPFGHYQQSAKEQKHRGSGPATIGFLQPGNTSVHHTKPRL